MRQLKIFCLTLVLAVAACRSIPGDVRDAYDLSARETAVATTIAHNTLDLIEAKSSNLNDEFVTEQYEAWMVAYNKAITSRATVHAYLLDNPKERELADAYHVGMRVFMDMNAGFRTINEHWEIMILDKNTSGREVFLALFRKDLERLKRFDRQFNDWIKQYKVKG